jgi:FkbM family methyltransferase
MIDGGANIGLFTVLMKNRYPNAKIICVEPDPENFALLQRNVAPYSDVYCENCGLWGKDTQLKAYDKYGYGKCGIITEESAEEGNVAAISMGSLLKKYGVQTVDVLKLDIESSEKQVFGSGFEAWLPKVKTLIVELHDSTEAGCAKAFFEAIQQTFSGYKFSVQGENVIIEQIP